MSRRRLVVAALSLLSLGFPRVARAQGVPDQGALDQAKELFRQGNELRRAGDCQAALERYLASRRLLASVPNTLNAAYCYDELGRYDEALELYEELLTRFKDQLSAEDRQTIAPAVGVLRTKVGSVDVSANVDGALVIDGRMRGQLPLVGPVRVMPGSHLLRVTKDGYEPYLARVRVAVGATTAVDAKLEPLRNAGRLKVSVAGLEDGDLFVDGALVGKLPWEGTLAPGQHVLAARKGDDGSSPTAVTVVAGQSVTAALAVGALGAEIHVVAQPSTAEIFIDGVPVAPGRWQGRLPLGVHTFDARAVGYFDARATATIGRERGGDLLLKLVVDPSHPHWGARGSLEIEVMGGLMLAPSLGSDAEASCGQSTCKDRALPFGFMAGARIAYEFPLRLSLGVSGGYLTVGSELSRSVSATYVASGGAHPMTYDLRDRQRVSGPFVAVRAGYRAPLTTWLDGTVALDVGAIFAASNDVIEGSASGGGRTLPIVVNGSDGVVRSATLFAAPELAAAVHVGRVSFGVGLAALFGLLEGPTYASTRHGTAVVGADCPAHPEAVDCASASPRLDDEHAYGRFVAFVPFALLGYRF